MERFRPLLNKVAMGTALNRDEAAYAFDKMMSGETTPSQMGALLMGLRVRGETVDEIVGAVSVMRAKMLTVDAPVGSVDVVGTGGDASGSYNISTCASFIVAGAGVPVAKHGNRALSSKSGAADVLAALGVRIDLAPAAISRCIAETGIGFMFAPTHHPAMKNVGPTRVELGTRTIFNLLGPLSNPAGVKRQMVGVFAKAWLSPLAEVLKALGSERAWVVHGSDGLDEITISGTTDVASLEDGRVHTFEISPEDVGLTRAAPESLRGGDAEHNAAALRAVLEGAPGAYRDVAVMNAGAALLISGRAASLRDGVDMAKASIDSGAAKAKLEQLARATQALAPQVDA
ncbi:MULTISPECIES: anthranilate phosphoribosyltransferase [Azorhizobium]|uniref:anthranilate phosphoribosyltransferase n=1 Tax=Azorhizobium TaxID=6 RepID=UPI0010621465|nr:anthranilate phosphoribosyltransferase [Azorhizobium sp. AG788]TDT99360.1 anthranilate phosphoribosyltransferase [Azorhizobium sp. AG788]